MSKSDCSSIDIDLFNVQPKLTYAVYVHGSESFVDLLLRVVSLHFGAIC